MWEDWNLRRCFTQKSSLFNCSLSTFQGEVSCKPDLAWVWCWQRGPACDCSPGKPLLAKGVGRRISNIRGTAAASEWAAAFRDHQWFPLGQRKAHLSGFLPFCPGHLAASLRAAPCSWLCAWESSEHQSSETATALIFMTINPTANWEELTNPLAKQSVYFSAWEMDSLR